MHGLLPLAGMLHESLGSEARVSPLPIIRRRSSNAVYSLQASVVFPEVCFRHFFPWCGDSRPMHRGIDRGVGCSPSELVFNAICCLATQHLF
mmetsp:Transcript_9758/g.23435  ORF Transcript_9758/g.23435 Transcript_9758/m.23435 type:complete len:92 (+) Transcript_9758:70-345(+)